MKEDNLEALRMNMDILVTGLGVCHIFNEKAISLILQYDILEKKVKHIGHYLMYKNLLCIANIGIE